MSQENRKPSLRIFKKRNVKFCSNTELIHSSRGNSMCLRKGQESKFRKLYTSDDNKPRQLKSQRKGLVQKTDEDQDIGTTLNEIQSRGAAFYKLGFNSLEKGSKQKKIFSDFFNLTHKDIKGTMSTGELWSNKDRSNFLKENKIHLNKIKLLEKIALFKRNEFKRIRRFDSSKNIFGSVASIMNLDTYSQIGTARTIEESNSKKNLINTINQMRKDLADLHSTALRGPKLEIIVKDLQGESQNWQKLQEKYFQKLIEMI